MELDSNLFDGIIAFVSDTSTFATPNLGRLLAVNGAVVSKNVNSRVTHWIGDEFDTNGYKACGAEALNIPRIKESYFLDSLKLNSLRNEQTYLLTNTVASYNKKRFLEEATVKVTNHAKSGKVVPQVDKYCTLSGKAQVYYDGTVYWDATLSLTNIANNNNKYYIIQLLECNDGSYAVWNRWGRQGAGGQPKLFHDMSLDEATDAFCKKFSKKTSNDFTRGRLSYFPVPGKYTWIEMEAGEDFDSEDTTEVPKFSAHSTSHTTSSSTSSSSLVRPKPSMKMDIDDSTKEVPKSFSVASKFGECTLDPRVADLIQTIFDTNMMVKAVAAMNYDVKKQPLGKLSKLTIKKALGVLKEIEDVLNSGKPSQAKISDCSNRFYTLIPHSSGKTRLPYIDNFVILEEKLQLLDTLNEIDAAEKFKKENEKATEALHKVHILDRQYRQLNVGIKVVEKNTDLWTILSKYVQQTHAPTHTDYKLQILDIFELDRSADDEKFVTYETLHNQQLLWHGSRMTNWVGILSQGLRIAPPEAPVTGYMFGKGVYFADISSKSANYCATSKSEPVGIMLACQVALGDTYNKTSAEFVKQLHPKYHSTKGVGMTHPDPAQTVTLNGNLQVPLGTLVPNPEVNASDLLYNEYIVYDVAQIKFKYLFKLKFLYK